MGQLLGLDYSAVYPLLDRRFPDPDDWNLMFEDIQAMESAALDQTRQDQ